MALFRKIAFFSFISLSALVIEVYNHITMKYPPSRPAISGKADLVANAAPLIHNPNYVGYVKKFPCGSSITSERTYWHSGETIPVVLEVHNNHGGGDCQFALAYSNDTAYVVFHTIIGTCMAHLKYEQSYPLTLPKNLPGGEAILCVAFIPVETDEYYHSCSDIFIYGERNGTVTGTMLVVANLYPYQDLIVRSGGVNGDLVCTAPSLTLQVEGRNIIVSPPELMKSTVLKPDDPRLTLFKRTRTSDGTGYVQCASISPQAGSSGSSLPAPRKLIKGFNGNVGDSKTALPPNLASVVTSAPPAIAAAPTTPEQDVTSPPAYASGFKPVSQAAEPLHSRGYSELTNPPTPAEVSSRLTPESPAEGPSRLATLPSLPAGPSALFTAPPEMNKDTELTLKHGPSTALTASTRRCRRKP